MATITVKNIPDELYMKLKQAASAHHRSLNSELIHCLEQTLTPRVIPASELIEQAQLLRSRVAAGQLDVDEIDAARKQGRA